MSNPFNFLYTISYKFFSFDENLFDDWEESHIGRIFTNPGTHLQVTTAMALSLDISQKKKITGIKIKTLIHKTSKKQQERIGEVGGEIETSISRLWEKLHLHLRRKKIKERQQEEKKDQVKMKRCYQEDAAKLCLYLKRDVETETATTRSKTGTGTTIATTV